MDGYVEARITGVDDGNPCLDVTAQAGLFSGHGAAWFSPHAIETFAVAVGRYPLSAEGTTPLASGYGEWKGRPAQTTVSLRAVPSGTMGRVAMEIHLAETDWGQSQPEEGQSATFRLMVEYEALRHWSTDLRRLLAGQADAARIEGFAPR
jgi:hypothetical protein